MSMSMPSTIVAMRTADVIEGRATIDDVEPQLRAQVQGALELYMVPRTTIESVVEPVVAPVEEEVPDDDGTTSEP